MSTLTFGLVALVLLSIVVIWWCWTRGSSKEGLEDLPFRKSVYFQVTDKNGTQSAVHDSGQDPVLRDLKFQILKREINDKQVTVLMTPQVIKYGFHPVDLNKVIQVHPDDIEDYGTYYVVRVARP